MNGLPNTENRPNILLIVADDMGWSDLGAFGGEIDTPHLDALAARGVKLTNFHASPLCSTTRAMLMTGCDHHQVGLGTMAEILTPEQRGRPGYEGYLNDRAETIAERLRRSEYTTLMSGKWHLGRQPNSRPAARGFDRSFALFNGEHNHYGADQTDETAGVPGKAYYELDGVPTLFPQGAYSTDHFTDRMVEFIKGADVRRPLFGYLAFTAPHSPLQAPDELIAKYRGRYDDGPEALGKRRLEKMRRMGISVGNARPADFYGGKPWQDLTPEVRRLEAKKMEVYAAMVDAMDAAVGRIIATLEQTARLDNTVVVFLSDNGPSGTMRETSPRWREWIEERCVNSVDNIGRANSYASIGPRWAEAQASPFLLFKRYTTEGGVRTCAFVTGPGLNGGRESDAFIHVTDLPPTLLELARTTNLPAPGKLPMRGISAFDVLSGARSEVHAPDEPMGWELSYARALRKGDWKAVYLPAVAQSIAPEIPVNRWLLFNLAADPGETTDLSSSEPGKLQELVAAWEIYASENDVVMPAIQ